MCGRYGRRGDKQRIAEAFNVKGGLDEVDFAEDNDCAPGSIQPVVRMNDDGERGLTVMRWGFKLPDRFLFNTRSEDVTKTSFWKEKFAENRCIVPASSFFEWQGTKKSPKSKYEITVPGSTLFGMAGVWAPWKNPKTDQWEKTFSIFTSESNSVMKAIHDRQPVVLEPRDFKEWLEESERPPVHLLRILPNEEMAVTLASDQKNARGEEPTIRGLFD
ncbi:SOS response-associated peptidase [Edaphobacter bradus]|uniref:SOS response-associated peptidase n=1 Tax=Edaphobacter bradus TaxID=2259016 RepID=UPI0021DFFF83|nr:SOS response-associated peptidase [Edaphobacter bradus]